MLKNTLNYQEDREASLSHQEVAQEAEKLLSSLKKTMRSNEKIALDLGKRKIIDIVTSGETFYMWACIDSTLAFLMQIKEKIPQDHLSIGCELLKQNTSWNLTFHLFLIDKSQDPQRIIDFVGGNFIKIYQWTYQNPKENQSITRLWLFELPASEISEDDNFLSLAQKMNINLPPSLFEAYIQKLRQDNTPENFEKFQGSSPIKIEIESYQNTTTKKLLETLLASKES